MEEGEGNGKCGGGKVKERGKSRCGDEETSV